jgi:prepilin-type N-terminal cleavage/methylation domain-containing protein
MHRSSNHGFTLIELLVVIAIIGILSSVVLASLNSARAKGRDARRISDLKQLQLALELYYDANGSEYPDTLAPVVTAGFIGSIPTDPQGVGVQYLYDNVTSGGGACDVSSGVCASYVIGATLEGTVPAGDPDNTIASVGCADPVYCVRP